MDRLIGHPAFFVPAVLVLAYLTWSKVTARSKLPTNLPWVGKENGAILGETRATYASFTGARQWLAEGYEKYTKKGKSYIFPDFSGRAETIIPKAKLRWLLDFPDDVASVAAAHYEQLEGDYNFTDPFVLGTLYHEHVVHKSLARNMQTIIMEIWDELGSSFVDTWGTDTNEWKDICVFDNMMVVIARASNRMFVGLPLCRDPAYLKAMGSFAQDVIFAMMCLQFVPKILKPVLGPLLTIPNRKHWRDSAKFTIPLIKERKANMLRKQQDPDFKWEEPNDYVTWHLKLAMAEKKTIEQDPVMVSRFLQPLNFAAIHTTVFTIVNTLFDILGSDPSKGYLEGILEEAERVYADCNGVWTKQSLARLNRADSAIRESMRYSNFATRGVLRKVTAPEGITNEEEGWTAPPGAFVGTDVHSVHHDPDIYPNPNEYDAFRFSRPIEEHEAKQKAGESVDEKEFLRLKNTGIVATSDTFLPFGHGRHACPGRFFVSHELKMFLAYMVMNYEVQMLPVRPPNSWFGQSVIPDMKATIRVKRKPGTV